MSDTVYGYDPNELGLIVRHHLGPEEVLCLCVFHNDRNASLSFNVKKGVYFCYGCGAKGNVRRLARETGGHVRVAPFEPPTPSELEEQWLKLLNGPLALDDGYLKSRGVTKKQVKRFGIRKHKDGVVIPLFGKDQKLCGVLMRRYAGKVRYLTLGEKPPLWPLWMLDEVSYGDKVAVVEGVFGVLAADRGSVPALASLGASVKMSAHPYLSNRQVRVVFDDDFAGYLGASRILFMNPSTEVVCPAPEADQLTGREWSWLMTDLSTPLAKNLAELAEMSGDEKQFYKLNKGFVEQFNKANKRRRSWK